MNDWPLDNKLYQYRTDGNRKWLVPVEPDGFVTVAEDAEWVPRFTSFIAPVPEGRYALVRIGSDDALTCPKCRAGDWMHGIGDDK